MENYCVNLLAKNILPEKFWIIEDAEKGKLGTIQIAGQRVRVLINGDSYDYADFESALKQHDISTSSAPIEDSNSGVDISEYLVNGYTSKDQPHNEMYDAKLGLPMYTKTEKSMCFYAAGYYIIRFDFAWAQAYCPKVITLKQNEFRGPYKTQFEMKEQLRKHNGRDKN
jgi:hypothetical protein